MDDSAAIPGERLSGPVKWYDPVKGFGFVTDDGGGGDVLLHGNVLRKFGQGSVAEGAQIEGLVIRGARGRQLVELYAITPPVLDGAPPIEEISGADMAALARMPLMPARVKWFDKGKGFGFATVYGHKGDVFVHIEVLRQSGFADLATGEAVALRIFQGKRGLMAAQVIPWDSAPDQGPLTLDAMEPGR